MDHVDYNDLADKNRGLEFRLITLNPLKRRIVYVTVFEILAILLSTFILMVLSDSGAAQSLPIAIAISGTAVVWNFFYNYVFEFVEQHQQIKKRTLTVRFIHALGFEGGLVLICLPLYMLWYGVGLITAFKMEVALLAFFLVYTFVFTFVFDKVFMLPMQMNTAAKLT